MPRESNGDFGLGLALLAEAVGEKLLWLRGGDDRACPDRG